MIFAGRTSQNASRGSIRVHRSIRRRTIACALSLAVAAIAAPLAVHLHAAPAPKSDSESAEPKSKPNKKEKSVEVVMAEPERQRFEEFMKSNSPKKWATYQQFRAKGADKPRTRQLENGLAGRFRELEKIRETDNERHAFEVQAIKIEDDAYGILQEIHAAKSGNAEQYDKRLHDLAVSFVDNRRAWRAVRIQRVKEELKRLGMIEAIKVIQDTEKNENPKQKANQVNQLVAKWKQGVNPKLKGSLPPGERPNPEDVPTTEPASTTGGK